MSADGLLGGRYRVDHVLGHGGAATVFAAHDTVLDRTVAIKILQRRRDETGVLHERFEREARAEAKVVHPNVVSVHDIGESEDGRPYIVMDYVAGRSLQDDLATLVHTLLSRDTVERPWDAAAVAERLGDIGARLRTTRTAGEPQTPL